MFLLVTILHSLLSFFLLTLNRRWEEVCWVRLPSEVVTFMAWKGPQNSTKSQTIFGWKFLHPLLKWGKKSWLFLVHFIQFIKGQRAITLIICKKWREGCTRFCYKCWFPSVDPNTKIRQIRLDSKIKGAFFLSKCKINCLFCFYLGFSPMWCIACIGHWFFLFAKQYYMSWIE